LDAGIICLPVVPSDKQLASLTNSKIHALEFDKQVGHDRCQCTNLKGVGELKVSSVLCSMHQGFYLFYLKYIKYSLLLVLFCFLFSVIE